MDAREHERDWGLPASEFPSQETSSVSTRSSTEQAITSWREEEQRKEYSAWKIASITGSIALALAIYLLLDWLFWGQAIVPQAQAEETVVVAQPNPLPEPDPDESPVQPVEEQQENDFAKLLQTMQKDKQEPEVVPEPIEENPFSQEFIPPKEEPEQQEFTFEPINVPEPTPDPEPTPKSKEPSPWDLFPPQEPIAQPETPAYDVPVEPVAEPELSLSSSRTDWAPDPRIPPNNLASAQIGSTFQQRFNATPVAFSPEQNPWIGKVGYRSNIPRPLPPEQVDVAIPRDLTARQNLAQAPVAQESPAKLPASREVRLSVRQTQKAAESNNNPFATQLTLINAGADPIDHIEIQEQVTGAKGPQDQKQQHGSTHPLGPLAAKSNRDVTIQLAAGQNVWAVRTSSQIKVTSAVSTSTRVDGHKVSLKVNCRPQVAKGDQEQLEFVLRNEGQQTLEQGMLHIDLPSTLNHKIGRALERPLEPLAAGEELRLRLTVSAEEIGEEPLKFDVRRGESILVAQQSPLSVTAPPQPAPAVTTPAPKAPCQCVYTPIAVWQ